MRSLAPPLWILTGIAALFFLKSAASLLIPIVIAVLISYALEPVVAWMERHAIPRLAGAGTILLAIVALGAWGVYGLRDDAVQAVQALPKIASRIQQVLPRPAAKGTAGQSTGESGQRAQGGTSRGGQAQPAEGVAATTGQQEHEDRGDAAGSTGGLPGMDGPAMSGLIQQGVGSALALSGHVVVVVFLVFFLLLSGQHVRNRLVEISGPDAERRRLTTLIIDDINQQVQRFLLVRAVTAVVVAALTWAALRLMGVENAAVWGILAGVFNSIPYFGPVIVSGGLLAVGLVQGDSLARAVQIAAVALAITSLEGWLITPPLLGKAERMSVLAVFLGLLLWSWLWGAWGTILAVPMLVVIKSIADRVSPLKPLGRLMAP